MSSAHSLIGVFKHSVYCANARCQPWPQSRCNHEAAIFYILKNIITVGLEVMGGYYLDNPLKMFLTQIYVHTYINA